MTAIIFFLGVLTVLLSITVAFIFNKHINSSNKHSNRLTNALSWQLAGEAVIGLGTLIFATAAHYGWLENWSIWLQSSLRLVMFLATSLTTIHLFKTIHSLSHDTSE